MANHIEIRKADLQDLEQLQKIGIQTFSETFSDANTPQDMAIYLEEQFSFKKLTHELENKNSEIYFATWSGAVIGYLKLNAGKAQTELRNEEALEIERIYVLKDFQGKRAGQLLLEMTIGIARQKKLKYVWLGVWEENHKAIKFYKKNGFTAFDQHIFKLGNDEQTDILMKLLVADGL